MSSVPYEIVCHIKALMVRNPWCFTCQRVLHFLEDGKMILYLHTYKVNTTLWALLVLSGFSKFGTSTPSVTELEELVFSGQIWAHIEELRGICTEIQYDYEHSSLVNALNITDPQPC